MNTAYAEWLDRISAQGMARMVVDGEEWFVANETDVVFHLISVKHGKIQRNGWSPSQTLEYK